MQGHPKNCSNIDIVIPRKILSVTWHGQVTDLAERTLTLAESARRQGFQPNGWFHLRVILPRMQKKTEHKGDDILQLGCIIE